MAKEEFTLTLGEMIKSVADGLHQAGRKPSVLNYIPHKKQEIFHKSKAKGRLYVGGNRSGKTVGGCVEAIHYMKGDHPYRKVPEAPTFGRIITVDFKNGADEIIIPQLKQWIPPSLLINGSWEDSFTGKPKYKLKLANNSEVEIMSHEQPVDKFAGTSREWFWADEELPEPIFKECKARLVDTNGDWWLTMTPVEGMTWIYDKVYEPYHETATDKIEVIIVDIAENPHIPAESRVDFLMGLDEEDRKIRAKGEFVALGGLLLREFKYSNNVITKMEPPMGWEWFCSIDHGFRNPSGILWHAISPNGGVYTFKEHYRAEWTVAMHAEEIKRINKDLGKDPNRYIGDLAMSQRTAVSGHSIQHEYQQHGIPVSLAKKGKGSVQAGVDKMNEYLRQGKWQISEECVNLIREIRKYRAKPYSSVKVADSNNKREEPQKKDDHAIDSARYMFTFMPRLGKPTDLQHKINTIDAMMREEMAEHVGHNVVDGARMRVYPWQLDPNLGRPVADYSHLEYGEVY